SPPRHLFFSVTTRRALCPPLFPYTTLFRSGAALAGVAIRAVLRAPWRLGDVILRRPVGNGVVDRSVGGHVVGIDVAGVQEAEVRSEEHTSELQSLTNIVCRLLLVKKKHKAT